MTRATVRAKASILGRVPPRLIGRDDELGQLLTRLEEARRGSGGVLLVTGEPGIGKTRLLAEVAERARGSGWTVLGGRATESEGMPPYLPFAEALREYARECPPATLRRQLGQGAAELALIVPAIRHRLPAIMPSPSLSPEHERYRLFEAVADFLLAIARSWDEGGLLLILDDLHWADGPSLALLRHLAERIGTAPLVVVGSSRPAEGDGAAPLAVMIAALLRERRIEIVELPPLAREPAVAIVEERAEGAVAPAVAEAIARQAEGNPFHLEEIIRHLRGARLDLTDARIALDEWGVPDGVQRVIAGRLARLSLTAVRALRAGAVLGDRFEYETLRLTSGLDDIALMDAIDETLGAGMLRVEDEGYRFGHSLTRRAVYEGIAPHHRRRLHRQAAAAIESIHVRRLDGHVAALALHYRAAGGAPDLEKAYDYSRRAVEAAEAVFAWEEAAQYQRAALAILDALDGPDPDARLERRAAGLTKLGQLHLWAAGYSRAEEIVTEAVGCARLLWARTGSPAAAAILARTALITGLDNRSDQTERVAVLQEALEALGDEQDHLRAPVLGALAASPLWAGDPARRQAASREAVAVARRLDNPLALATALDQRHWLLWTLDDLGERLAISAELVEIEERHGNLIRPLATYRLRATDLLVAGDREGSDAASDRTIQLGETMRHPGGYSWALRARTMRALRDGRLDAAERLIEEMLALRDQPREMMLAIRTQLEALRWEQGRAAELETQVRAAVEHFPAMKIMRAKLGLILFDTGRADEARRLFDRMMNTDFIAPFAAYPALPDLAFATDLCCLLGDATRAATLHDLWRPHEGRHVVIGHPVVYLGAVTRYLARLAAAMGRWVEAIGCFEDALAAHERMGAAPLLAHTKRELAEMLLRRGRRRDLARARALLDESIGAYRAMGMGHWEAVARGLRTSPRLSAPLRPFYPDGLTEREVEVLRLIAAGKSNREIADAIVVSVRTAENHIASIYGKLGLHGRAAATAYAIGHDLIAPPAP